MANVYLVHQPGPFSAGKLLVIKHLKPCFSSDEEFVQMFANESRIAVRLNHSNVVHTYEVAAEGENYYLALEFLNGKNLRQVQQRVASPMPLDLQLWVLGQVLSGLHYAHELKDFGGTPMGIVHRDVSPTNVFLTYDGEVKLLDFGIAKCLGAMSATREGIVKGKLGYASPEQCLCTPVDRRTDIYSSGVMLWEAIAGHRRSRGETEASVLNARIHGLETPIEEVCPHVPAPLAEVCNRALQPRPEDRYQTALEMRQALARCLSSKIGSDDLARFMRVHFKDDIDGMQRRLAGYVCRSGAPSTSALELSGQASSGHHRVADPADISRSGSTSGSGTGPLEPSDASFRAHYHTDPSYQSSSASLNLLVGVPWYRQWRLLIGMLIGVASVVALTVWLVSPRSVVIQQVPVPASGAASDGAAEAAVEQRAGTGRQVMVNISASPSEAVIRLDGRRVSNPYGAMHGSTEIPHHVTVTMRGYDTVEEEIVFDRPVSKSYTLVRSSAARPSGPRWVPGLRPVRATQVEPEPSEGTSNQAAEPAKPGKPGDDLGVAADDLAAPGEDLGAVKPRPNLQDLDERDPYK